MKLVIDLPIDVAEGLGTLAIREHRHTPQQAAYLLTRWIRKSKHQHGQQHAPIEPVGVGRREQEQ